MMAVMKEVFRWRPVVCMGETMSAFRMRAYAYCLDYIPLFEPERRVSWEFDFEGNDSACEHVVSFLLLEMPLDTEDDAPTGRLYTTK